MSKDCTIRAGVNRFSIYLYWYICIHLCMHSYYFWSPHSYWTKAKKPCEWDWNWL